MNTSHNNIMITPETPPNDDTPSVKIFTGICTEIYCPKRLTANNEQSPCSVVRKIESKNFFDFTCATNIIKKYKENRIPRKTFTGLIFSLLKNIGHIIFIKNKLKLFLDEYNNK